MPTEAIECPKCGSTEATEFKPGSYICGHCESVFKVMSTANSGAVGCEVDGCGVLAVGRCRSCSRTFCASHSAPHVEEDPWKGRIASPRAGCCTSCEQAAREMEEARQAVVEAELAGHRAVGDRIEIALFGLEQAGSPGARPATRRAYKKGKEFRTPCSCGWAVGSYRWRVKDRPTWSYALGSAHAQFGAGYYPTVVVPSSNVFTTGRGVSWGFWELIVVHDGETERYRQALGLSPRDKFDLNSLYDFHIERVGGVGGDRDVLSVRGWYLADRLAFDDEERIPEIAEQMEAIARSHGIDLDAVTRVLKRN